MLECEVNVDGDDGSVPLAVLGIEWTRDHSLHALRIIV